MTERQKDRKTERQKDRKTESRKTKRHRERETYRLIDRMTQRHTLFFFKNSFYVTDHLGQKLFRLFRQRVRKTERQTDIPVKSIITLSKSSF